MVPINSEGVLRIFQFKGINNISNYILKAFSKKYAMYFFLISTLQTPNTLYSLRNSCPVTSITKINKKYNITDPLADLILCHVVCSHEQHAPIQSNLWEENFYPSLEWPTHVLFDSGRGCVGVSLKLLFPLRLGTE